jgi:ATP-dependent Clp protease protease subunit
MVDGARLGPPPDLPSLLLNNRIVYLGMPINAAVTELIISELLFLQYDSASKPILMYINSPGTTLEDGTPVGYETEAFAIADTMVRRASPPPPLARPSPNSLTRSEPDTAQDYVQSPIHTTLVGKAYGLAAMLLASGTKGKRAALPYGTVMLHQPRGMQAQGQASDIALTASEVLSNRRVGLEITSRATGVPIDVLARDTERSLYMDAAQALEYGIVDKIIDKVPKKDGFNVEGTLAAVARGLG